MIVNELSEIHKIRFNSDLNFKFSDLESFESAAAFSSKLDLLGIRGKGILKFLKN